MPAVPSGNCHAGIVMIAERCADFVKTTHGLHRAAVATGGPLHEPRGQEDRAS